MRGKWAIFIAVLFSLLFVAGVGTMLAMSSRSGVAAATDGNPQGSTLALMGDTTGGNTGDINNGMAGDSVANGNPADSVPAVEITADDMLTQTGNTADSALVSKMATNENSADGMSAAENNADGNSADDVPVGENAANGNFAEIRTGSDQPGNTASGANTGDTDNSSTDTLSDVNTQTAQTALSQEESDRINLELARRLRASYDKIVVLDPGHGGTDSGLVVASSDDPETNLAEKDLSLQVALKVKEILEGKQICVILTRDTDMTLGESSRVLIANGMPADLFISLHVRSDADTTLHGMSAVYNASFYSPRIQNAQLAYDLLKNMEDVTKEKSLGMFDADRDADIMSLMIPSVELSLGQLSNAQDVKLLMRDDYKDKLALGIADGILASFDRMDESKNQ
ncbi:MAG: N-acetylmuramoyl-L-alanine amidase [Lachnospiraceae bacterium]|nr:N-acetylmuramoyl-L-alanine amidase [Lachnospiraceae bacterium]